MNKIGEKIRECRTSKGLTLGNLGEKIGLSAQTIQKYETGAIENVSVQTLTKIARALEVSPAYLMGWEEEKTANIVESAENKIVNALLMATRENKIKWERLGIMTRDENNDFDALIRIRSVFPHLLHDETITKSGQTTTKKYSLKDVEHLNSYLVCILSGDIYLLEWQNQNINLPEVELNILKTLYNNETYNHQIDSFQSPKLIDLYRLINNTLLEQENKPLFDILNDLEKL